MEKYLQICQERAIQTSLLLYTEKSELPLSILSIIQSFLFVDLKCAQYRWNRKQLMSELRRIRRCTLFHGVVSVLISIHLPPRIPLLEYRCCPRCGRFRNIPMEYLLQMSLGSIYHLLCYSCS